jgi:hypothetical protein
MKQKKYRFFSVLCVILAWAMPASAQSGGYAEIAQPNYDQFPEVTAYLEVYNQDGTFADGLTKDEFTLTENNIQRPLTEFIETSSGIQWVIAINMAPPFAVNDFLGNTRWEYLSQHLIKELSESPSAEKDDLSIITNDGLEKIHLRNKEDMLKALEDYQPLPTETSSNLNVLAQGIDVASDPVASKGMKRAILFLTPSPTNEEIAALQSLTSRAEEREIRIFAWLISYPASFTSPAADQLRNMGQETQGGFFPFSGAEELPGIQDLFDSFRGVYLVTYNSGIRSPGPHQLEISVNVGENTISASRELNYSIRPPNPILVTPPLEIERNNPDLDEFNTPIQEYIPKSQQLKVIVEFPDGHPRPLEKTTLEVDGEIVQSNTAPPFDRFSWDLSKYEATRVHYLRVLVEDHLGLSQSSVKTPVKIIVNKPDLTLRNIIKQYPVGLASLGGILIAAFALLILISKGVIYPKSLLPAISSNEKDRDFHPRHKGHQQERSSSFQRSPARKKPGQNGNLKAYAVLHSYNQEAKAIYTHGLPISKKEENFGRNPHQTTILVDHPSVSGIHARLSVKSNMEFHLSDEGSQAGTWVNFQEIPEKYPVSIQDGDIIHFGKIGFQFRFTKPGPEREITITEENSQ